MPGSAPTIVLCPASLRSAALRILHDALPTAERQSLVSAIEGAADASHAWDGLFVSFAAGDSASCASDVSHSPLAAVWVQLQPGGLATVWLGDHSGASSRPLLEAAAEFVDSRRVRLAQLLASDCSAAVEAMLAEAGFPRIVEMHYLYATLPPKAAAANASSRAVGASGPLRAVRADADWSRFAKCVEATYVGTRDCPVLDGLRPIEDVLAGYRYQGRYLPEQWTLFSDGQRDVGALILADHPGGGNWELIYMGVVAEARGRGYGDDILRFALQAATTGGAERLVLAVDAENAPARAMYERAGFATWDKRRVYARICRE